MDKNLGRSIIKSKKGRSIGKNTSELHNVVVQDGPEWSKLGSITEQNDLDELMAVAHLAGKEFTAERLGASFTNPEPGKKIKDVEDMTKTKPWLRIPRRPAWNESMSKEELHHNEQEAFLTWRRQLANLEESEHFIMTPFERNIEIWRQLWRVVEASDLLIQIVDARNPDAFYCEDLFAYAKELSTAKNTLLLVNKADLLTSNQRLCWKGFYDRNDLEFVFYSAISDNPEIEANTPLDVSVSIGSADILSRPQLLDFLGTKYLGKKVGFVGYPNVGKSSTINSLIGEKKVAVAITPGKTKHFQTIILGNGVTICDCPGLVFPNFSLSKSDLVLNGILPVDQLRDWISPVNLLATRIPRDIIERLYGIHLPLPGIDEDPDRQPTGSEILSTYAIARGFMTSTFGNPDQARVSRTILKDHVAGKLLYTHAPPETDQNVYVKETFGKLRTSLPFRAPPNKSTKKVPSLDDEILMQASVGFKLKKPMEKAAFSKSKKHYKDK